MVDKFQDMTTQLSILFECISGRCVKFFDRNVDGYLIDVQIDLKPSQNHIDLVIADGGYTTDCPRYASLAAATSESVDVENEPLAFRWTLFEIMLAGPVGVFALLSCSL